MIPWVLVFMEHSIPMIKEMVMMQTGQKADLQRIMAGVASLLIGGLVLTATCAAQDLSDVFAGRLQQVETNSEASFRGLSVVSSDIVWASGSGGTVIRTTDGGKSFEAVNIPGAEDLDFRDIEAFSEKVAVAISAGNPAKAYRTEDGGKNWTLVYEKSHEKVFFDSMAFWNAQDANSSNGIAFSDPIDGKLFLIRTSDGGRTWTAPKGDERPAALEGEAGFAASGTCLTVLGEKHVWIGLGGKTGGDDEKSKARVAMSHDGGATWQHANTCLASSESAGIFSLVFADSKTGVAVGGDYLDPKDDSGNVAITSDGGVTWSHAEKRPDGFRSAVDVVEKNGKRIWITTGESSGKGGIDYSIDDGKTWQPVTDSPFHTARFSPDGSTCWMTGADGHAAKMATILK